MLDEDNKRSSRPTDCLECRVTGTMTCLAVATYSFHELAKTPPAQVGHRRWLFAFGSAWVGAAIARVVY
ncbi:hypothetical protein SPRG_03577 [Saprolegnia parasitica CBS 223.65]|uniref:DUF4536 domain-containing protein n=1 Tax=Saprolegnia parasitica (strain CBS 223.65) TaxID=695850 RepID=A0A067CXZ6_SAPPC|nr:hypothetical protein SPRG_03577 [Saprolegnia parasitica CBS 223.65]KDO31657.1 hypothetical protein SPRG_03577 [Saprolegnia parasitica CBS 223.65]|eukprot:XP_012197546.1 hypothetical protein SPRG_03577 [Saprolegnia parasitica CBS 223.65]